MNRMFALTNRIIQEVLLTESLIEMLETSFCVSFSYFDEMNVFNQYKNFIHWVIWGILYVFKLKSNHDFFNSGNQLSFEITGWK